MADSDPYDDDDDLYDVDAADEDVYDADDVDDDRDVGDVIENDDGTVYEQDDVDAYDDDVYDEEAAVATPEYGVYTPDDTVTDDDAYAEYNDDDDSWWGDGIVALLVLSGVVLFLIPEPATSTLGIILVLVGIGAWIVDWWF
ncbi:MAG: hypothetical protein ABEJ28_10000 [Salinigranum sp.]